MGQYGKKGLFWSAMAELTPRRIDYVTKPYFGKTRQLLNCKYLCQLKFIDRNTEPYSLLIIL